MTRPPIIRAWGDSLIVDSFAGGGGASTGIELALGRSPDLAVNHDDEALAMHAANHPTTEHRCESVWDVDPLEATCGKPVALLWLSPDCTHHSRAKGGKPRDQKIRGLADSVIPWAETVRPAVIVAENVIEFLDWGPLDEDGYPIEERKGEDFQRWKAKLESLGYVVEIHQFSACDFGAPTTRRRLFVIARCDGKSIRLPVPTHGPLLLPYRTAADCMDWTLSMPSIFERTKPLVEPTLRRIARGVRVFVLETPAPYFAPMTSERNDHALAIPFMIHRSNGERPGQAPRIYDIRKPLGTIVAQGQKHALCVAWLMKNYSERATGGWNGGQALDKPLGAITVRDHHTLVAAFLSRYDGGDTAGITINGERYAIVDIGMRWLSARELFTCQGFDRGYRIAVPGPNGKPLSDTAQKRMCGNSVSPPIAAAVVRAQFEEAA